MTAHAWEPAPNTMLTPWGETVNPENAWTEYPRPQLVRETWTSLNGIWDVAVTKNSEKRPTDWSESILVPFALETPLSGVGRRLEPDEVIWYHRTFEASVGSKERLLLHFEGVDYRCMVWVNDVCVGDHTGGNLPFSFDISKAVKEGSNTLVLRVFDHTDEPDHYQLRGKQRRDNSGIWYSPSSGIWAPVWLEPVPECYIKGTKIQADMLGNLLVNACIEGASEGTRLKLTVKDEGSPIAEQVGFGSHVSLTLKRPKLWSPQDPHLYDLEIELLNETGQTLDRVFSYTGFRTVGKEADEDGHWRFILNGKPIFHFGPLDQGWWPGSFLLPPADEAIVWEIQFLKQAGFNMIRKHKKVEPRRYYYHADRLGMLIWQDQPSGGMESEWPKWRVLHDFREDWEPWSENLWKEGEPLEADWPDWAHQQYMAELKGLIDNLFNHPSVVVWTPFNERWAQHRTVEVGTFVKEYDPTRHLNIASGGNFFPTTDIADAHDYPNPNFPLSIPLFDDFIKVVGEFGGHGWPVEGHLWDTSKRNWGYGGLPETREEYVERYRRTAKMLGELRGNGISAGVYTQTTDVEGEINGLMTYDRKVLKIPAEQLLEIHRQAGLVD